MDDENNVTASSSQGPKPSKAYLEDPRRIYLIKQHRRVQQLNENFADFVSLTFSVTGERVKEPMQTTCSALKPIKLGDMDPTVDQVFEGRVLRLTLIEDPIVGYTSLHLLAEDEDGMATPLYIYNVPQDAETCEKFGFGQQLDICHPYMRIAIDKTHGIRVDEPNFILTLGKKENMCRYCGQENAPMKCARCKKAPYCAQKCQIKDWTILGHKKLCKD